MLTNPTQEEMEAQDPLIAFSWYLSGRKNCVLQLGAEIRALLDGAFSKAVIDGGQLERAGMFTWFWTLGAYEIVRTMCQAKECFAPALLARLGGLKKQLAQVRMPAAKMEKPGTKRPVTSSRSPAGWDPPNRDLLIGDPTSSMISVRSLLKQFEDTISSIARTDILRRHEDSYGHGGPLPGD